MPIYTPVPDKRVPHHSHDKVIPLHSSLGTGVVRKVIDYDDTRYVFFGLTEDGYFCAYTPPKWAIEFDTDMDYESDTYGCLKIKY